MASSSSPAATVLPPGCRQRAPVRLPAERWPAAHRRLAPPGARAMRLCRYAGLTTRPLFALVRSRLLRDRRLVNELVRELDGLQALPPGMYSCPEDDGSQIVALLAYPAHVVTIAADLTGCRGVSNGSLGRTASETVGPQLLGELERLTGGYRRARGAVIPSSSHLKIRRPLRPVWCPMGSMRFDARSLLGLAEKQAEAIAVQQGCTWRVVERNGHSFPITMDLRSNRVDLTIDHGLVTAVYTG